MNKHIFEASLLTIEEFKIVKGNIENPEDFDSGTIEGFEVNNNLTIGFRVEDQLAKADLYVKVHSKSKNIDEAVGEFHFVFIYSVENLNDFVKADTDNGLIVNKELFESISEISYSTARGVLLTKVQGGSLENFILPIVNPMKSTKDK